MVNSDDTSGPSTSTSVPTSSSHPGIHQQIPSTNHDTDQSSMLVNTSANSQHLMVVDGDDPLPPPYSQIELESKAIVVSQPSSTMTQPTNLDHLELVPIPSEPVPMQIRRNERRRLSCTHCVRDGLFNALLRRAFYHYGMFVGKYAPFIIFVVLLGSLNAIGLMRLRIEDRVRDGFTPIGSPSFREYEIYKDFMGTTGDPMFTVAIVRSKDNGSMVRGPQLRAAVNFAQYMLHNFTIHIEDFVDELEPPRDVKFAQLCDNYCNVNKMLQFFQEAYEEQETRIKKGEPLNTNIDLDYPIATVALPMPVKMSMFRVFRQVTKWPQNEMLFQPSRIKHVSLVMLLFRSDKTDEKELEMNDNILARWEREAYKFVRDDYNDPHIRVDIIGSEILNSEIIRGGRATVPFFAVGFVIMSVFVLTSVLGSALYFNQMDNGKFFVAFGTIISPMLAVASTMGFSSLLGFRINSMTLVVPFLVMAIGVDDAFLMIHAWQRLTMQKGCRLYSVSERLGFVLEEAGPSITITSLTNCLAFGIGAMTPTPEIRLFARTAAIAMAMDFLFEITFFASCLAISARWEKQPVKSDKHTTADMIRHKLHSISGAVLRGYCKFVANRLTALVTLGLTIVYWVFIVIGAIRMQPKLDGQKLLPHDSPLKEIDLLLTQVVWHEHHPVSVVINRPLNLTNETMMSNFYQLVNEFETMENAIGKVSTLLWLRDYTDYFHEIESDNSFFGFDLFGSSTSEVTNTSTAPLSYIHVPEFLEDIRYKHFTGDVRYHKDRQSGEVIVDRFMFSTVFRNTSDWSVKVHLMQRWRTICNQYPGLNASVFEAASHFIDQIISLKSVTVTSVVCTFVCMAIVCAVFIPSPCSVICASWAIAAISLGTFGFLSWWGMDLDPVVMSATLMTVGVSVDFTAHVSYHYQHTGKQHDNETPCRDKLERLERTLGSVMWPMTQAGLSTVMCVLPLVALRSYAPEVFVKSIGLVVLWGLIHGLLVLPTFLSALPDCMTGAGCCEKKNAHNSLVKRADQDAPDDVLLMQVTKTTTVTLEQKSRQSVSDSDGVGNNGTGSRYSHKDVDGNEEMVELNQRTEAVPDDTVVVLESMPSTSYRIATNRV